MECQIRWREYHLDLAIPPVASKLAHHGGIVPRDRGSQNRHFEALVREVEDALPTRRKTPAEWRAGFGTFELEATASARVPVVSDDTIRSSDSLGIVHNFKVELLGIASTTSLDTFGFLLYTQHTTRITVTSY